MKYFSYIIFAFVLFLFCGNTKAYGEVMPGGAPVRKVELNSVVFNSKITIKFPDFANTFQAKIKIAGRDSLSLTALGPFGIVLGKLYADSGSFIFYNVMENSIYTGVPSEDNLFKATKIRLNYNDLVSIMRNESPDIIDNYSVVKNDVDQTVYLNKNKSKFAEFFLWSKADDRIKQYQRKDLNDKLIMNVFLSNPETADGFKLSKNMSIVFPAIEGSILIDHLSIEVNEANNESFHFKVPSGAKVYEIN